MSKLFKTSFEHFAKGNFELKGDMNHLRAQLNNFKKNNDFTDYNILHRFPKKELKYFLRVHCPTESAQNSVTVAPKEIIEAGKRLRNVLNLPE